MTYKIPVNNTYTVTANDKAKSVVLHTKTYKVTVRTAKNPDYTVTVMAPKDGLAEARAMANYPHPLSGDFVEFDVEVVK
jgi:hypothetical protein